MKTLNNSFYSKSSSENSELNFTKVIELLFRMKIKGINKSVKGQKFSIMLTLV